MNRSAHHLRLLTMLIAAALAWSPAYATTGYRYAKDQDVVIDSGMARRFDLYENLNE
jgi:hypothetical protein